MRTFKRTLLLFSLFLAFGSVQRLNAQEGGKTMPDLERYTQHSESTDPGEHAKVYEAFPPTLREIWQFLSDDIFIDPAAIPAQEIDVTVPTAAEMLEILKKRDHPFAGQTAPEAKFNGLCYHWALLAASVLRERGVACRLRCGFAPYLTEDRFGIDHTILEVWDEGEGRWQLEDVFNPQKASYETFHFAAAAWSNIREKKVPDEFYGLGGDSPNSYGFVRQSLIRDWLSVLGHERNVFCPATIKGVEGEEERAYLERIAKLMMEPDKNLDELEKLSNDIDFESPREDLPDDFHRRFADLRPILNH